MVYHRQLSFIIFSGLIGGLFLFGLFYWVMQLHMIIAIGLSLLFLSLFVLLLSRTKMIIEEHGVAMGLLSKYLLSIEWKSIIKIKYKYGKLHIYNHQAQVMKIDRFWHNYRQIWRLICEQVGRHNPTCTIDERILHLLNNGK